MKKIILFYLCVGFALSAIAQEKKVDVLILGTSHFFNMKDDSVTSPQKQKELAVILSQLKAFSPQQILVESSSENDILFRGILTEIKKSGRATEEKWILNNEIYQLGIRLAAQLNLSKGVEGIDWPDPQHRRYYGDIQDGLRKELFQLRQAGQGAGETTIPGNKNPTSG